MSTENVIVAMVKKGGDRQVCHEKIRVLSHEAGAQVKQHGNDNDLMERIKNDPYFKPIVNELDSLMDANTFIGRAPQQVDEFLTDEVQPILNKYSFILSGNEETVILNI